MPLSRGIAIVPKKAKYSIGLIPGDGIGKSVIPEGCRVVDALAQRFGFQVEYTDYPWSCDYYLEHGVSFRPCRSRFLPAKRNTLFGGKPSA